MKLPPNIPTALVFTFLFSLQVPLRLAAPLSHDKLFPKPVIPLTLPQIHYERIDNGRMAIRHSNPNSNKDFPSPLLLSLPVPLPSHLQKSGNALWDATTPWKLSQPKRESVSAGPPKPQPRSTRRPGRYPRPLKHLFAHSYRHSSSGGRGVVDSDFDFDPNNNNNNNNNNVPIKRTLSETADDDLNLNFDLFSSTGLGGGSGVNLLKTITIEPTLTINSTSIQRLGPPAPGPGAGSYLAAMNMGGAAPRPREAPWESMRRSRGWEGENESGGSEIGNEAPSGSFMNRRVGRTEKRLGVEKREMMTTATEQTGIIDENTIKRGEKETKEKSKAGRGSRIHGRYHEALTSVAATASATT